MTIAIRGTATQSSASGVCAKPTGVVSGDVLVAAVGEYNAAAVTLWASTGWTVLASTSERGGPVGSDINAAILYKVAGGSEPSSYTFTATGGGGNISVIICAYSGVNNATPFDTSSSNNSAGTTTTVTGTGFTAAATGEQLLLFWFGDDFALSGTPTGSTATLSARVAGSSLNLDSGFYGFFDGALSGSGATGNYTSSTATADTWIVMMAALNAAASLAPIVDTPNQQRTVSAVPAAAMSTRGETLPSVALAPLVPWPADWGYRTPAAPPAKLVTRTDVLPAPQFPTPIAWAADWGYRTQAAKPALLALRDVQLPIPQVLRKAPRLDRDYQTRHVNPTRATADPAVLKALAASSVGTWTADGNRGQSLPAPQRALSDVQLPSLPPLFAWAADGSQLFSARAPSQATRDVQLPALTTAGLPAPAIDWAYPFTTPRITPAASDQPLPQMGVDWAADWLFVRPLPGPARAATDAPLSPVSVLSTWAADGNAARALPGPLRGSCDAQLPAVNVLSTWAADGNQGRALAAPVRVAHDVQPPAVQVLSTWAADGNAQTQARGPARATHDGQFPAAQVMSTWAADGNLTRQLPPPARAAHTTELKAFPPPLLFTWCADGNGLRLLPAPLRVTHDVQEPKANALYGWAPESQASRLQPAPSVARTDTQLPAIATTMTAKVAADWNHQRALPAASRATHDQPFSGLVNATRPVVDWFYPRALPAARPVTQDGAVVGSTVLDFAADWNFQRAGAAPARVTLDSVVADSTVAPYAPDWYYTRPVGSVAMSPLFGVALPRIRPPTAWAADWNFQRAQLAIQTAFWIAIALEANIPSNIPGCAHGTIAALYSATGSMFLTASASGLISPLASATSKITGCT